MLQRSASIIRASAALSAILSVTHDSATVNVDQIVVLAPQVLVESARAVQGRVNQTRTLLLVCFVNHHLRRHEEVSRLKYFTLYALILRREQFICS